MPKPDDVSEQVWQDFQKLRKAKRAPLTQTALDDIKAEAAKAGISLEDALRECCARGWQGFKAPWHASTEKAASKGKPDSRAAARRRTVDSLTGKGKGSNLGLVVDMAAGDPAPIGATGSDPALPRGGGP